MFIYYGICLKVSRCSPTLSPRRSGATTTEAENSARGSAFVWTPALAWRTREFSLTAHPRVLDVRGEILQLKETLNTMVEQLRSQQADVSREVFPGPCGTRHVSLAAETAFDADFAACPRYRLRVPHASPQQQKR